MPILLYYYYFPKYAIVNVCYYSFFQCDMHVLNKHNYFVQYSLFTKAKLIDPCFLFGRKSFKDAKGNLNRVPYFTTALLLSSSSL